MANIDLTVKTLDSQNHQFSVSDELTVKELKEHIAGQVGTPAETQRLIYCGRVLQDDKKLRDYDLNGKVVHLVQRAPPSTNTPPAPGPTNRAPGSRPGNVHYHLDRGFQNGITHTYGPIPPPAGSSALLRLNTARHMVEDASQSLTRIANIPPGDGPLFVMDNTVEGNYSSAVPFAQATAAALAAAFSTVQSLGGNNITVVQGPNGPPSVQGSFGFRVAGPPPPPPPVPANVGAGQPSSQQPPPPPSSSSSSSSQPSSAPTAQQPTEQQQQPPGQQQIRNPRVSLFADVIEDVERIQQELRPHLTTVRQLLRDDPTMTAASPDYRRAQHTYNQVSESLHYLAHAFHALSDLMVDFGAPAPREVRARPYVYQQAVLSTQIPIHASISVETTTTAPRPAPQQPPAATQPPAAAQPPTAPAADQPANPPPSQAPPGSFLPGMRASYHGGGGPVGTSIPARSPAVAMMRGPHPFARLPMAMAGGVAPMVFMEVRSSNGGHPDDHPPVAAGQSASAQSEFDAFLQCHSRHLSRASRGPEAARPSPRPTPTTTQVPRPSRPTAPVPLTVADFVNEVLRQADGDMGAGGQVPHPPGGMGRAPPGQVPPSGPAGSEPVVNTAMFSNLLQGIMQEMAGVMSGQQTGNTVAQFLRNIPDFSYTPGEAFVFDLFMAMAEHLTFRDLVGLFYGSPEVLGALRVHMRTFARQHLLDGAEEFTEANVRRGTMRLVNRSLPLLQSAAAEASIRGDVDFVASMANLMQQRFQQLVQLIGAPGEDANFGVQMMDHIRQSVMMAIAMALTSFSNGMISLERVFLTQLRGMSEGIHPTVQAWTTNSSLERLRSLTATVNLDQLAPVVGPMLMNAERGTAWRALWAAELEEASEGRPASSSTPLASTAPPTAVETAPSAPLAQAEDVEEAMETDEPPAAASASAPVATVSAVAPPPRTSRLEKLRQETLAAKPEPEAESEPAPAVVHGSQPWHHNVPPEWVPVIARDIQRQSRAGPQAPLSDAYLAGIPTKRRKMAAGDRPNCNPQILVRDTMERALRSANVSASVVADVTSSASLTGQEVSAALVPELRRLGSARLDRDPDFDPERFPNADKYFHGV